MNEIVLRVGTRRSVLARWQTDHVIARLARVAPSVRVETLIYDTEGDDALHTPLTSFGTAGVFTSSLERGLLRGDIDIAVHSLKDLPLAETPGVTIAAMPSRADRRDVLVARDGRQLRNLPFGAVVGTCSVRRTAQLLAVRSDLSIRPIRGTVERRIQQVVDGEYDATVLAAAGLDRLGLRHYATETFDVDTILPEPGQGTLAVQCRANDRVTRAIVSRIDDPTVRGESELERQTYHALAGQRVLITRPKNQAFAFGAALARYGATPVYAPVMRTQAVDPSLVQATLRDIARYDWIVLTSANAVRYLFGYLEALGLEGALVGKRVAAIGPATARALSDRDITATIVPERFVAESLADTLGDVQGLAILLPRAVGARDVLAKVLAERGASVDDLGTYTTVAVSQQDRDGLSLFDVDVITLTSPSAVRYLLEGVGSLRAIPKNIVIACIGPVTAAAASIAGLHVDVVAEEYTTDGLVTALVGHPWGVSRHRYTA